MLCVRTGRISVPGTVATVSTTTGARAGGLRALQLRPTAVPGGRLPRHTPRRAPLVDAHPALLGQAAGFASSAARVDVAGRNTSAAERGGERASRGGWGKRGVALAVAAAAMWSLLWPARLDAPAGAAPESDLIKRVADANELLTPDELETLVSAEVHRPKAQQARKARTDAEPGKAGHVLLSIRRSATIATAVVGSMWDYRRTLNAAYGDEDARRSALSACHTRSATRVLHALQANGGIYIKLGQHVSSVLFIPPEWRETLKPLQDQNTPTPLRDLEVTFQAETGKSFDEAFSHLDPVPIGVASLAQVHRGVERGTQREVAIKMMHPDVERFSRVDMANVNRLTALVKRTFPSFEFSWLAEEMNQNMPLEMDFKHESGNAEHARRDFAQYTSTAVYIPQVYFASKRVMVMEFIHGKRPDDLEYLRSQRIDRNQVSQELSKAFSQMLYVHGFFHADPHAGNVLIRAVPPKSELAAHTHSPHNFELVLLDHGLYFCIPQSLRADYARFWLSLLSRGTPAMQHQRRELAKRVGNIGDDLYPILEGAITGRSGLEGSDPKNPRGVGGKRRPSSLLDLDGGSTMTPAEQQHIQRTMMERDGLFSDVLRMLRAVPRQMLMVLKLNDLTRSLDMNLRTTHGPIRPFLISARYCAWCVWDDDWRRLQAERRQLGWSVGWTTRLLRAWYNYAYFNYGFRLLESYTDVRARMSIVSLYLRTVLLHGFVAANRAAAGLQQEDASERMDEAEAQAGGGTALLEAEAQAEDKAKAKAKAAP